MDWTKRARRAVLNMKPYIPGKPIEQVQRELGLDRVFKLASNENPLGPSPRALERVREVLSESHRYPDDTYTSLRQALAQRLKVEPEMILLGRGSDEILLHIVQTFIEEGDRVVFSKPSFAMYDILSCLMGAQRIAVPLAGFRHDLKALADVATPETKVLFLDSPNNPTGTIITNRELESFFDKIPEGPLLVLDEAYQEFVEADDYHDGVAYVKEGRPVIVLRTFSKAYGLAGFRIGYGIADPELVRLIARVREPFNVSSLAVAAALGALEDDDFLNQVRQVVWNGKKRLYQKLNELGLFFVESQANFVLIDAGVDCREVSRRLQERGFIVRPCDIFGL
ncbi:MAG: histidinol-phosphate transaminase, partial [Armatimonadetes bacterium]|nr:histidinol-phosphate transaminase [Armatimonadota bacterium]